MGLDSCEQLAQECVDALQQDCEIQGADPEQ